MLSLPSKYAQGLFYGKIVSVDENSWKIYQACLNFMTSKIKIGNKWQNLEKKIYPLNACLTGLWSFLFFNHSEGGTGGRVKEKVKLLSKGKLPLFWIGLKNIDSSRLNWGWFYFFECN